MGECKHAVSDLGLAACYNCVIEENSELKAKVRAMEVARNNQEESFMENRPYDEVSLVIRRALGLMGTDAEGWIIGDYILRTLGVHGATLGSSVEATAREEGI